MARRVDSRLRIRCTLVARTPLHVGGMGADVDTDLALAVNGAGDFYVPGTSLSGALRGWLMSSVDADTTKDVERLWGWQRADKGHASYVFVEDALVTAPSGADIVLSEIRDGVGIDRFTGAAANRIKFDRAILPRGSQIDFQMDVELAGPSVEQNRSRALTHVLLDALVHGQIRLGGGKTRGLGRLAKVKDLSICEQGFNGRDAMLKTLRGSGEAKTLEDLKGASNPPVTSRLMIEIGWGPTSPFMVKAEGDGCAVDILPLVSGVGRDCTLVLPGSSIKGALRSQAERIARTVLGQAAKDLSIVQHKRDFIDQISLNRRNAREGDGDASLIGWLFGVAANAESSKQNSRSGEEDHETEEDSSPLPGLSALTIDDCYCAPEARFSRTHWSAIETANDEQELATALARAGLSTLQQSFHVAIDRWLGSAAEGMLYSVLEPHSLVWEPISMMLDFARLPSGETQVLAVMLLLLTLRDLARGRIGLGFGVNRGMGAIEVTEIKISSTENPQPCWATKLNDVHFRAGDLVIPQDLRQQLNGVWRQWARRQLSEGVQ